MHMFPFFFVKYPAHIFGPEWGLGSFAALGRSFSMSKPDSCQLATRSANCSWVTPCHFRCWIVFFILKISKTGFPPRYRYYCTPLPPPLPNKELYLVPTALIFICWWILKRIGASFSLFLRLCVYIIKCPLPRQATLARWRENKVEVQLWYR